MINLRKNEKRAGENSKEHKFLKRWKSAMPEIDKPEVPTYIARKGFSWVFGILKLCVISKVTWLSRSHVKTLA